MRGQIYRCTNDNTKKNLERKGENTLWRHVKIQLTSSMKSQTLNKEKSFQDFDHEQASKRFLTGFETRGQPNHGPVFAQCCSVASVFL